MNVVEIKKGLIVVANGKVCQVVRCQSDGDYLVSAQASGERFSVSLRDIEFLPAVSDDGTSVFSTQLERQLEGHSRDEISIAALRFDTISDVFSGNIGLEEAIKKIGVSRAHFYRLKKRYCPQLGFMSVIQKRPGVKRDSSRLSDVVEEIIQRSIDKKYIGASATSTTVWKAVEKECIELGISIPSKTAIKSRLKKIDPKELMLKKEGREAANQKHDAKPGKLKVFRPLEMVQMDHTKVDVIIVDEELRKPLGRPWLTVIVDVYTRAILGYYLSLHAPSTVSVACAITHAALPKFSFLSRLDIDDDLYPFYGVPKTISMDNAKEFKSLKFERACSINNINPEWRPYGKKHYGGYVERLFGKLMIGEVHLLPGTTYSNVSKRRGHDSDKTSTMTFKDFCRWFARQVILYHSRVHSGIGMSPAAKWKEYFNVGSGSPAHPPLVSSSMKFRLDFMPEQQRCINTEGVKLNGYLYWDNSLMHYVGRGSFKVKYDPFSLKTIWIYIDGDYLPVNFSDATMADLSLAEHKAKIKQKKILGALPSGALDDHSLVSLIDECDALIKESKSETRRARLAAAAKKEYLADQYTQDSKNVAIDDSGKTIDYSVRAKPFKGSSYD